MATSEEQFAYDVFLSYNRHEDGTGNGFPRDLQDVLNQNGFTSYKYGEDLDAGEEIDPAVDKAIEDSQIAVVVFSRRYASSTSCLSELVKILEQNNLKGMMVIPLFFKVEPSWVRRQRESYHEAMAEHESRYGSGSAKVKQWTEALKEVADLRGLHLQDQGEADFIQGVVQDIGTKLQHLQAKREHERTASSSPPATAGAVASKRSAFPVQGSRIVMSPGFSIKMTRLISAAKAANVVLVGASPAVAKLIV